MRKKYREMKKKFTTNTYMREALEYDIVVVKEKDLFITIKKYKEMSKPFILTNEEGKEVTYIDQNYYVVELTPLKEHYNIRYYFDEEQKFIDYYIDISLENGIQYKIPYYIDLYLDILHYPKSDTVQFCDEDELEEAFKKKIISKRDYDMAYQVGNKLLKEIKEGANPYLHINVLPYIHNYFKKK